MIQTQNVVLQVSNAKQQKVTVLEGASISQIWAISKGSLKLDGRLLKKDFTFKMYEIDTLQTLASSEELIGIRQKLLHLDKLLCLHICKVPKPQAPNCFRPIPLKSLFQSSV